MAIQRCVNCNCDFETTDPPDHAYMAIYGQDDRGEPLVGLHCDECGENMGLPRLDLAAGRKQEIQ